MAHDNPEVVQIFPRRSISCYTGDSSWRGDLVESAIRGAKKAVTMIFSMVKVSGDSAKIVDTVYLRPAEGRSRNINSCHDAVGAAQKATNKGAVWVVVFTDNGPKVVNVRRRNVNRVGNLKTSVYFAIVIHECVNEISFWSRYITAEHAKVVDALEVSPGTRGQAREIIALIVSIAINETGVVVGGNIVVDSDNSAKVVDAVRGCELSVGSGVLKLSDGSIKER